MWRNIIKISIVAAVAFGAFKLASFSVNELVIEAQNKKKTLADVIIQKEVAKQLEVVQKQIDEETQKENLVIEEQKVEMKPPIPQKVKEPLKEAVSNEGEEIVEQTTEEKESTDKVQAATEEMTTDASIQVMAQEDPRLTTARQGISEGRPLTKEEVEAISLYLVENYFLDGYTYSEQESDPVRKARKHLANNMEHYVMNSLEPLINSFMDFKDLKKESIQASIEDMKLLQEDFKTQYGGVKAEGPEFEVIYNEINDYFDLSMGTLDTMQEIAGTMDASDPSYNPILALPTFMQQMTKEVLPSVRDVINKGIDLKEETNKIYLEGLEGKKLLTRDEVVELIMNTGMNTEADAGFSISGIMRE